MISNNIIVFGYKILISILLSSAIPPELTHAQDFNTSIKTDKILNTQKKYYYQNNDFSANSYHVNENSNNSKKTFIDHLNNFFDSEEKEWYLIITILSIGMTIMMISGLIDLREQYLEKSFKKSIQAKLGQKKINSVMVLGIGGVGKTSLIKTLSKSDLANPKIQTNKYSIYDYIVDQNHKSNPPKKQCQIYLSDYAGAELDNLIRGFIEQQFIHYSPMRYDSVTSLILVVDLFSPPNLPDEQVSKSNCIDENRIQENIDYWDEKTLSFVFGMLTSSLKYICLFINKIDLLDTEEISEEEIKAIKKRYDLLFQRLALRSSGVFLTRILGSAATGKNLDILQEHLIEYSMDSNK